MPTLEQSYAFCRETARREAKNFYFSFVALPKHKSDAMCAVYAFMRRADDLADDESALLEQRRLDMTAWLQSWRAARQGQLTEDPVFIALNDTQRRFAIPDELLEKLVQGTTMDLSVEPLPGVLRMEMDRGEENLRTIDIYRDFDSLYHYCYLVASVVGLVCIRIFGYRDPQAEKLAEETGVAFQLTNILRDVKEDAERGRIYLPLSDLAVDAAAGVEQVMLTSAGELPASALHPLLKLEADRAERYYASAQQLLPLIDQDSRGALWVLVAIYHRLLQRIVACDYDVFTERIRVPTSTKLALLGRGMVMAAWNRLGAR